MRDNQRYSIASCISARNN